MKKIYLLFACTISFSALHAQIKEGTVIYERKINMYKLIQDEQMRAMMPEFRISKHILLFSDSTSMYKTIPEDEAPDPFEGSGGGGRVIMRMGGGDGGELYKNFALSKSVELTELGAKTFIVEDSIRNQKWKLSDETKIILGHNCHKAITQQTTMVGGMRMSININGNTKTDTTKKSAQPQTKQVDVIAWYADDIQTPVGPENNGGLPGVILQLNINDGQTVYTATEIKKELNRKELKEPSKGKKVTKAEFQKLQMEMMNNMGGSGMSRTIRM